MLEKSMVSSSGVLFDRISQLFTCTYTFLDWKYVVVWVGMSTCLFFFLLSGSIARC